MTKIPHKDPAPLNVEVRGPKWRLDASLPPWRGASDPDPELYPIRVVTQDVLPSTVSSDKAFFSSSLVVQGDGGAQTIFGWDENFDKKTKVNKPVDALIPRLLMMLVKSEKGSQLTLDFLSRAGDAAKATGEIVIAALAQIIARPEPASDVDWPSLRALNPRMLENQILSGSRIPDDIVTISPTRLVLGDIRCTMKSDQVLAQRLKEIGWTLDELRLAPDGIVIRAHVAFPGRTSGIDGHFLLHPAAKTDGPGDTGLRLRLLPEELTSKERKDWLQAWQNVSPAVLADSSLQIQARSSALPPAFSWTIRWQTNTQWQLDGKVDVPVDWVRMVVIGRRPQARAMNGQDTDGAAILLAERVTLEPGAGAPEVVLRGSAGAGERQLTLERIDAVKPDEKLTIAAASGELPLRHGAHQLAATLREIQGDRKELFGFVAADHGWLQLPLPNVAPPNPELDQDLVKARAAKLPSVLDGFVRWSASVDPKLVTASITDELDLAKQAPWSITVEEADGFALQASLTAGTAGQATLGKWSVALQTPEISTRGLLWLSADAPNANEALPRLGAGPGSFFDVPFEINNGEQGEARFSLARLELDPRKPDIESRRLSMKRQTGGASWVWLRHERLPLAATMPMTRSGGESVRPLESRDLAPFVVTGDVTPLAFGAGSALAGTAGIPVARLDRWPWPKIDGGETLGVAFAALGVPGVEFQPRDSWSNLQLAVRYDLPLLDEAFATAKLPKQEDAAAPPPKAADPAVTALDRDELPAFWKERERKQELTRVEDSYFIPFDQTGTVENLISPAKWSVTGRFDLPSADDETLPYGTLVLEDTKDQSFRGDVALAGVDAKFTLAGGILTRLDEGASAPNAIEVRGFAPSTYGDLMVDNRGFGAAAETASDGVRLRTVNVRGTEVQLRTLLDPITIAVGDRKFELWFKDLPFTNGVFTPRLGVDVAAWTKEQAPVGGYEVRLVDAAGADELRISDTFRLWSFDVTFLGLVRAKLSDAETTFTLALRLQLPAADDPLHLGGHRVEVTIKRDGNVWKIQPSAGLSATALLRNQALDRLMRLAFTPAVVGDELKLMNPTLSFVQFGAPWSFSLDDVALKPGATSFKLDWKTAEKNTQLDPVSGAGFHGRLVAADLHLTIDATHAELDLDSVLRIENHDGVRLAELPLNGDLKLLGLTIPAMIAEDLGTNAEIAGALVRQLDAGVSGELFEGFTEAAARNSKGLLAVSFAARDSGTFKPLPVIAGCIELEITPIADPTATGVAMRTVRIAFSAGERGASADDSWSGQVELYGSMQLPSAIDWPASWERSIASTNLVTVRAGEIADPEERFITHTAAFHLEGQTVPLDQFAGEPKKMLNRLARPWSTLVLATHELKRTSGGQTTTLRWSSIEPFTLATLGALVDLQPDDVLGNDPRVQAAFAGGHRLLIGSAEQNKKALVPVAAIFKPGFGRRADVLGGADNRRFRTELAKALDAAAKEQLVAVAGFAGVVMPPGTAGPRRLLRVPFLARLHAAVKDAEVPVGLTGKKCTQTADHQPLVMPRHDTPDALVPKLELTTRHAVRPADARAESLFALLTAERRAVAAATQTERVETAVLAEQAFASDVTPASIEKTPFWIGAALGIEEVMNETAASADLRSLSLVSGRFSVSGASPWQSVAAVAALDFTGTPPVFVPPLDTALITLGDDLVLVQPFAGRDTAPPVLVRTALVHHAASRAVALRAAGIYTLAFVPLPFSAELPRPAAFAETAPAFAQAQRGFARRPFTGKPKELTPAQLSWSSGMLQAGTDAIFDREQSGLAGLATAVALPHAATALDLAAEDKTSSLLWLGEKRAAPYLPLKLTNLNAPPFGWLSVAPPRARLPIREEVMTALRSAGVDVDSKALRTILPDSAGIASVSERAGVLTARRLQLLGRIPKTPTAFDPSFARFGAAAQSSNAPMRQLRTPRPGALPPERRPSFRFLRGTAETLSGFSDDKAWKVAIVAMPATGGIVSNRWDGSVRLRCRFEFDGTTTAEPLRWLFAQGESGTQTKSQAWLSIGDVVVPFTKMSFERTSQQVADVILDFDAAVRRNGLLPQAAALNAVPPPPVELYLLVHPDNGGTSLPVDKELTLTPPGGGAELPGGRNRLPVTLEWPLAPVSTERGAVPLRPVSVLFADQAYDEELTTQPLDARADVTLNPDPGRMRIVFSVDRRAAEINGRIAVMVDLRFERRPNDTDPGEDDLDMDDSKRPQWLLRASVIPRIGVERKLLLRPESDNAPIRLGFVHELSLAALRETESGKPVQWLPGDRLKLSAVNKDGDEMKVTLRGGSAVTAKYDSRVPLSVNVPVSDEPSFEPPPALYAVLQRTPKIDNRSSTMSVPLFAQSPQATRVDAEKLAGDIRRGLIRRKATFLWRTAWPLPPTAPAIYVMKQDRNGQTHLPEKEEELAKLEAPLKWV
ncbi:MAG TPA: hypothetical protein VJZ76_00925 [Thermoanaerobaculia bacterium]|nr:hypothetical protein [Thermoanaerobaculia bacterium]